MHVLQRVAARGKLLRNGRFPHGREGGLRCASAEHARTHTNARARQHPHAHERDRERESERERERESVRERERERESESKRARARARERETETERKRERERERERNTYTLCSESGDAHALVEHQRALPFYFLAMKTSLYFKKNSCLTLRLALIEGCLFCVRYSPAGMS